MVGDRISRCATRTPLSGEMHPSVTSAKPNPRTDLKCSRSPVPHDATARSLILNTLDRVSWRHNGVFVVTGYDLGTVGSRQSISLGTASGKWAFLPLWHARRPNSSDRGERAHGHFEKSVFVVWSKALGAPSLVIRGASDVTGT